MSELSGIGKRRAAARDERSVAYVQRRQEIVRAAARVFKSNGLQGASLGDIAVAAGADRASLYYYVGSKEELFHEVVREAVERNLAAGEQILAGDGNAPEKLRCLIVSLMRSYAEYFPVLYVFIQEDLSHVPESQSGWANDMRRVNRRYEQILIDIIEQGMREGSMRSFAPARELAYGILGMVGWTHRWFNPSTSSVPAAELGRIFADTILGGLGARGRARGKSDGAAGRGAAGNTGSAAAVTTAKTTAKATAAKTGAAKSAARNGPVAKRAAAATSSRAAVKKLTGRRTPSSGSARRRQADS
jgi:AcrR family transcriptional regulator